MTFNVVLDKTFAMDQPLWFISVDLSKAFDRVNWESLWQAVGDHGASQHLVWILPSLYYQQRGKIVGSMELACDKGVFSAHVYFAQSLSGHYPNGGRNAMVLATTSKTEGFLYWTCALLMISLSLQNRRRKSVTC